MTAPVTAVAVGGGTGLPKVLWCLLELGCATTAVVTVADDGGSSGHLRRELGMLPPGDARNCLVAMAQDPDSALARVFQYRFPQGEGLAGHALGNLIIAALASIEGGFPEALAAAADMLGARGRVLPSTLDDVVLAGVDVEGARIVGQENVAYSDARIRHVRYVGAAPGAYPPAMEAIAGADLVVVGPGSLFTSVIPNFLVTGMADALRETDARVVYVCNVANQRGETSGMDAFDHVRALLEHGLESAFDLVAMHDTDRHPLPGDVEPVEGGADTVARIEALGLQVVATDLADPADPRHHSRDRLLRVLREAV